MKFLVIILKEKNSNQKKVKFHIAFILVLYQSNNSFPPKNKNRHLGGFYISFFLDWTKKMIIHRADKGSQQALLISAMIDLIFWITSARFDC